MSRRQPWTLSAHARPMTPRARAEGQNASPPSRDGEDSLAEFRARRHDYPLWEYEALTTGDRWSEGRRKEADAIVRGSWRWKGQEPVDVTAPVDWEGLCASSRSWHLALHAWEPLGPVLAAYQHTGDPAFLNFALAMASDWLERYPSFETDSPFAWYDAAVGMRAYRLGYLLDVATRLKRPGEDEVAHLLAGLLLHAKALGDEERFADHSNHGFYQLMGQLAMARRFPDLPTVAEGGEQGRQRLSLLLRSHFTREGVHREHSPEYHYLVLIPIGELQRTGLVGEEELQSISARIQDALAWFITPASRLAMFGDTTRRPIVRGDVSEFVSEALKFAISGGRAGHPPDARSKGFPESGYVVFRDRWPTGSDDFAGCSYLAQTCAFHSRTHKHADDLSFVWYDRGVDILTDAGRFGYVGKTEPNSQLAAQGFWYSDPHRIYVESTRAHNTVEIDDTSAARRGVEPYGSALTQWGEANDIRYSEARVDHGHVEHTRILLFSPAAWLIVLDHVNDKTGEPHRLVQRFHLAPELEVADIGDSVQVALPSGEPLHVVGLLPQARTVLTRGQTNPDLLGWMSPQDRELVPQWTFGYSVDGVASFTFATLFAFASEAPAVALTENRVDSRACAARLGWKSSGLRQEVGFQRVPGRSFRLAHRLAEER